jgi:uncharacterized protein RhaS with RHS repeats
LYGYRSRYYDPALGRFISEDPAGGDDNLYAYCGNNPINATDPLGLDPWFSVTADGAIFDRFAAGAIVGAAETYLNLLTWGGYGLAARYSGGCYNTGGFNAPFSTGYRLGSLWMNTAATLYALDVSGVTIDPGLLYAGDEASGVIAAESGIGPGTTVYRVYGGEATPFGNPAAGYFTTVDPSTVGDFRVGIGLYSGNTGQFVVEAKIVSMDSVIVQPSAPGLGGIGGGYPELIIPNSQSQISVIRVSGANPPF